MASLPRSDGLVLVIEPDESIRQLLAELLRRAGLSTVFVDDWDAAVAALDARGDVIIADGTVLRSDPEQHVLQRTVITTAIPAALEAGRPAVRPFAVLRKPFDIELLVETVRSCRGSSLSASADGGAKRDHAGGRTIDVGHVSRFLGSMPELEALLSEEPGSARELLLRDEIRRTARELARAFDQAAQREGDGQRAAILLGAALAAAQLASSERPGPDIDH